MKYSDFKKDKFAVIKKAIDPKVANFIYNYFLMKRQVAATLFETKYISPFESMFGVWNDAQIPDTYSHYADIAMETLLLAVQPVMEKTTGLTLIPNYSYARIYKKADILHRHKDRFSCEISTTLNLGGDEWPIYINPNAKAGYVYGKHKGIHETQDYQPSNEKGISINLKPGDMLVYRGSELEHWREPFQGENCGQVFLHYNNIKTPGAEENMFDKRPHLGLPAEFKRKDK